MTYALLCLVFLAAVTAAALLLRRRTRGRRGGALLLGGAALLILTAVFDSVMIGVGLFAYADVHLLGPRIGLAPLEDFSYPLAAVILLPALWWLLRREHDDP